MIQLTDQQHQAIDQKSGDPIRAIDPATNEQYVLLRADVYDRLKLLLTDTGDDWADGAYTASMGVFARDGWDDPKMDVYDSPPADSES